MTVLVFSALPAMPWLLYVVYPVFLIDVTPSTLVRFENVNVFATFLALALVVTFWDTVCVLIAELIAATETELRYFPVSGVTV